MDNFDRSIWQTEAQRSIGFDAVEAAVDGG
jgi:hypothetical protein